MVMLMKDGQASGPALLKQAKQARQVRKATELSELAKVATTQADEMPSSVQRNDTAYEAHKKAAKQHEKMAELSRLLGNHTQASLHGKAAADHWGYVAAHAKARYA